MPEASQNLALSGPSAGLGIDQCHSGKFFKATGIQGSVAAPWEVEGKGDSATHESHMEGAEHRSHKDQNAPHL